MRRTPDWRSVQAVALAFSAIFIGGCDNAPDKGAEIAAAPSRAGEVWELDRAGDRAAVPAAVAAYVSGLHVMVLDGDSAYAGMTRLRATRNPAGARVLKLAHGAEVELAAVGDGVELRFADAGSIPLRRQAPAK